MDYVSVIIPACAIICIILVLIFFLSGIKKMEQISRDDEKSNSTKNPASDKVKEDPGNQSAAVSAEAVPGEFPTAENKGKAPGGSLPGGSAGKTPGGLLPGGSAGNAPGELLPAITGVNLSEKKPLPSPPPSVPASSALHIPTEMLDDDRNGDIRGQVEEAVRDFRWDAGSGDQAFIYLFKGNPRGWKCPFCEGENREDVPICLICGRKPPAAV